MTQVHRGHPSSHRCPHCTAAEDRAPADQFPPGTDGAPHAVSPGLAPHLGSQGGAEPKKAKPPLSPKPVPSPGKAEDPRPKRLSLFLFCCASHSGLIRGPFGQQQSFQKAPSPVRGRGPVGTETSFQPVLGAPLPSALLPPSPHLPPPPRPQCAQSALNKDSLHRNPPRPAAESAPAQQNDSAVGDKEALGSVKCPQDPRTSDSSMP